MQLSTTETEHLFPSNVFSFVSNLCQHNSKHSECKLERMKIFIITMKLMEKRK